MNKTVKWTTGGLLAALLAFFGYKATIAPITTPPKADTTIVAPRPIVDTPATIPVKPETLVTVGGQVLGDDFTKYSTTADFLARVSKNIAGGTGTSNLLYTDGVNANLASLDRTVLYNGHPTLKYSQPGGQAGTPELWVAVTPALSHLWLRAHIRFSPGFTTAGTLPNAAFAYKLLGWGYPGYDGSGRLEITNTNQYDFYWGMAIRNTSTNAGGGNHTNGGLISTEWTDGAWYTYVIEVDNTQKQAVTRYYLGRDTGKPVLRAMTTGTMKDGSLVPPINYVMLGLNFNQVRTATQTQYLWYGDWSVADGSKTQDPFGVR